MEGNGRHSCRIHAYIIDWLGSGLCGKNWDDVIPPECLGDLTNGGIVVDVPVVVLVPW